MSKPTKAQLARLVKLKDKKRKLESEVRGFEKEIGQLESQVEDYLDGLGRDSAKVNGYQCTREPGRVKVSWKDELISCVGAEAVNDIAENAPRGTKLVVVVA
jgi:hypothetical protein